MLHDPDFITPDSTMQAILSITGSGSYDAQKIKTGLYAISHFSFDHLIDNKRWENYPELGEIENLGTIRLPQFNAYGVCDSLEQFLEHELGRWIINHPSRKFCVSFTHISKNNQPSEGGWRWHKWGPYIGNGEPEYEYLYDESGFEEGVYTFHIYEKILPFGLIGYQCQEDDE